YRCLIQCHTGHAFLGEYYSTFIPTEDPSCPCGKPMQTREHVIISCPMFESNQNILHTVSEDLIISNLLGMEKGIKALVELLNVTNAPQKMEWN
ncbi:hypothetical protein EDC04DRAFT_2580993, partial [Pisolithus marmoratus]